MWHPAVTVLNTDVSLLSEQIKGVTVLFQLSEGFPKLALPIHHHHCWTRSAACLYRGTFSCLGCTRGAPEPAWEHLKQPGHSTAAGMEPCQCVWELRQSPSRASSLFLLEA